MAYGNGNKTQQDQRMGFGDDLGQDGYDPEGGPGGRTGRGNQPNWGDEGAVGFDGYDPEGGGTGPGGRLGRRPAHIYTIKSSGEDYSGLTLDYGGRLLTTTTGAYEGQFSKEVTLKSTSNRLPRGSNKRNQKRRQRKKRGTKI
jgi:hypothetical protein